MVNFSGGPGTAAPAADPQDAPANSVSYDEMRNIAGRSGDWTNLRDRLNNNPNTRCQVCGSAAGPFSADHVVPFQELHQQLAGSLTIRQMVEVHNFPNNLVPLCRRCNQSRGANSYPSFLRRAVSNGWVTPERAQAVAREMRNMAQGIRDVMGRVAGMV